MKINILIPHKEKFDIEKLSSVSITIINNFNFSKFQENTKIFGKRVKNPAKPNNFIGIRNSLNIFKSKNVNLAEKMLYHIKNDRDKKQLVEIHNRPFLFEYIFKKIGTKVPISIFFHNNPLEMRGSKTLQERKQIVQKASAILCVSNFIKKNFLLGFDYEPNNIHVLYNGVDRTIKKFPKKINEVLFVGRIVQEKGVHLFINCVEKLTSTFPNWKFCIVGSSHLGEYKEKSAFSKFYIKKFLQIGKQAYFTGYISNEEVQNKMKEAAIVVVPSIWEEPFGLVVAEAMSNGAAIITTNMGGIPEIVGKNGILIKNINEDKLRKALHSLMLDKKKLENFQNLSWKNFKYTSKLSSVKLDKIRADILDLET